MFKVINIRIRRAFLSPGGSVTVEAAIVLPTILLILFSLVFFSMYIYHNLILLDTVVYTARQRAATWDDSSKSIESGFVKSFGGDGLYWRVFHDFSSSMSVTGSVTKSDGPQLVQEKNQAAANLVNLMLAGRVMKPGYREVNIRYKNFFLKRTVSVDVVENIVIPLAWMSNMLDNRLAFKAEADVVEPVEFIRNIDLAEKYQGQLISSLNAIPASLQGDSKARTKQRKLVGSSGKRYGQHVKVYHYPGCRYIARIKENNLIEFDTTDQANGSGYYLCLECAKRVRR